MNRVVRLGGVSSLGGSLTDSAMWGDGQVDSIPGTSQGYAQSFARRCIAQEQAALAATAAAVIVETKDPESDVMHEGVGLVLPNRGAM